MSQWRVGHKVPINVYEFDRPVCQCHNPEDAARIVKAMNAGSGERADLLELAGMAALGFWPAGHRHKLASLARRVLGI